MAVQHYIDISEMDLSVRKNNLKGILSDSDIEKAIEEVKNELYELSLDSALEAAAGTGAFDEFFTDELLFNSEEADF